MAKADPPPTRVRPLPISVLHTAQQHAPSTTLNQVLLDAAYIGFFFMLRAGEYLDTRSKGDHHIQLRNVTFTTHNGPTYLAHNDRLPRILSSTYAGITFDMQKNGHRGASIVHHHTGHPHACPVWALQRRVHYLRQHNAPPSTPLTAIKLGDNWFVPHSTHLTDFLRQYAASTPTTTFDPADISPRSLRSGGAMALLLAGEDKTVIQLIGRWKSDALFSYLHSTALPLVKNHAQKMLKHGKFTTLKAAVSLPSATTILDENFIHDEEPVAL